MAWNNEAKTKNVSCERMRRELGKEIRAGFSDLFSDILDMNRGNQEIEVVSREITSKVKINRSGWICSIYGTEQWTGNAGRSERCRGIFVVAKSTEAPAESPNSRRHFTRRRTPSLARQLDFLRSVCCDGGGFADPPGVRGIRSRVLVKIKVDARLNH